VLEVGPGAGSILRWIAGEVGPEGKVIGIDQNPRFLEDVDLPNASVIKGDITAAALDDAPFDLVYSRFVMLHLPDPAVALRCIFDLLKPGGKLVLADIDFASEVACDPDHPVAAQLANTRVAIERAMRDCGLMDLRIGRRLPGLMAEAGFVEITAEGSTHPIRGGTDEAWIWKRNDEIMVTAGIDAGTMMEGALSAIPDYDDPTFSFLAPLLVTAFAERPS
jgi:SAM-dependent methyltransferase